MIILKIIDYPDTTLIEGTYTIIVVKLEDKDGDTIVHARLAELGEDDD